jgi:hypothetical protein
LQVLNYFLPLQVEIKTHNKANKMNIDKEKLESIEAKLYVVLDEIK